MFKKIIPIIFFTLWIMQLFANGKVVSSSNDIWQTGQVYIDGEINDVSIEKELLVTKSYYEYTEYRVHYLFKNYTDKQVVLHCGFPVGIEFYFPQSFKSHDKYYFNITPRIKDTYTLPLLYLIFVTDKKDFMQLSDLDEYLDKLKVTADSHKINTVIKFKNSYLKRFSMDVLRKIFKLTDYYNKNRDNYSHYLDTFSINQDGKPITVKEVWFEIKIAESGKGKKYKVNIHYIYDLKFNGGEYSEVNIKYKNPSFYEMNASSYTIHYYWGQVNYIVGTGNGWKGPIKKFVFVRQLCKGSLLDSWTIKDVAIPSAFTYIGKIPYQNTDIFMAENYEPDNNDKISFSYGFIDSSKFHEFEIYNAAHAKNENPPPRPKIIKKTAPNKRKYYFINQIKASSYKSGRHIVYEDPETIYDTSYKPICAFDGILTNAWVPDYNKSKKYYIEFTLNCPAYGLRFILGERLISEKYYYIHSLFDKKHIKNIFKNKKRTRNTYGIIFTLKNLDTGEIKEYQMKDEYEWPLWLLLPGTYRLSLTFPDGYSTADNAEADGIGEIFVQAFPQYPLFYDDNFLRTYAVKDGLYVSTEKNVTESFTGKGTTTTRLRLRTAPYLFAETIVTLGKNEKVLISKRSSFKNTIDGITDYWFFVKRKNGSMGWCFGGYLKK